MRKDGKIVKTGDPVIKFMPHIMKSRTASQNLIKLSIDCDPIDHYIQKTREEKGVSLNYMSVLIAAFNRVIYERPKLNYFIQNGKTYSHNNISFSFSFKKRLSDDQDEDVGKVSFNGNESIFDVHKTIVTYIKEQVANANDDENSSKFSARLAKLPHFIVKMFGNLVLFIDKKFGLPKALLEFSPFHSTMFFTNLKSIKVPHVYHHLYEIGTVSLFCAMGKEHLEFDENEDHVIVKKKKLGLGITTDDRICDGLYYGNSMRLFQKYLANPELLENTLEEKPVETK